MARPVKNNCDYFPHDRDFRDLTEVKAVRTKHGIVGYAILCMLKEYLTGADGNTFPYNDRTFELLAGDFRVSATEIREVIDYCVMLEILTNDNGFIRDEELDERLAPVYAKRGKAKELSKKQQRSNGQFATDITEEPVVTVAETPQSKVKESKPEESKENSEPDKLAIFEAIFSDERYLEGLAMAHPGKNPKQAFEECWNHHSVTPNPPRALWEWKQKLNTWLTIKAREHGPNTKTKRESPSDLAAAFARRHGGGDQS